MFDREWKGVAWKDMTPDQKALTFCINGAKIRLCNLSGMARIYIILIPDLTNSN